MTASPSDIPASKRILTDIRNTLCFMARCGCRGFEVSDDGMNRFARLGQTLPGIRADLGECLRCRLSDARRTIVFGAGNPGADLVFVGDAPCASDDRAGLPFTGDAGDLLTRIVRAISLDRDAVYLTHIVKCRPPEDRSPRTEEISSCLPFLKRQMAAVRPRMICAIGEAAARVLTGENAPLARLRGRFFTWMGVPVLPTHAPSFILKHPEYKREVWDDMKSLMGEMGLSAPPVGKHP